MFINEVVKWKIELDEIEKRTPEEEALRKLFTNFNMGLGEAFIKHYLRRCQVMSIIANMLYDS
jgi:hypothetical protein